MPLPPAVGAGARQKDSKSEVANRLAEIVEGISSPIACGGSVSIGGAGVTVRLLGDVPSAAVSVSVGPPPRPQRLAAAPYSWNWRVEAGAAQEEKLKGLIARMPPAAFGHGKETKVDEAVRDALQLQAGTFEVDMPQAVLDDILSKVRAGLSLDTEIVAECYSLNAYRKNGHFLKHKDSPRGVDMLGTLVVCLPSYYTGGAMRVVQAM